MAKNTKYYIRRRLPKITLPPSRKVYPPSNMLLHLSVHGFQNEIRPPKSGESQHEWRILTRYATGVQEINYNIFNIYTTLQHLTVFDNSTACDNYHRDPGDRFCFAGQSCHNWWNLIEIIIIFAFALPGCLARLVWKIYQEGWVSERSLKKIKDSFRN
jgi:hypothetical protein